jgi:hypothetical protein
MRASRVSHSSMLAMNSCLGFTCGRPEFSSIQSCCANAAVLVEFCAIESLQTRYAEMKVIFDWPRPRRVSQDHRPILSPPWSCVQVTQWFTTVRAVPPRWYWLLCGIRADGNNDRLWVAVPHQPTVCRNGQSVLVASYDGFLAARVNPCPRRNRIRKVGKRVRTPGGTADPPHYRR